MTENKNQIEYSDSNAVDSVLALGLNAEDLALVLMNSKGVDSTCNTGLIIALNLYYKICGFKSLSGHMGSNPFLDMTYVLTYSVPLQDQHQQDCKPSLYVQIVTLRMSALGHHDLAMQ